MRTKRRGLFDTNNDLQLLYHHRLVAGQSRRSLYCLCSVSKEVCFSIRSGCSACLLACLVYTGTSNKLRDAKRLMIYTISQVLLSHFFGAFCLFVWKICFENLLVFVLFLWREMQLQLFNTDIFFISTP